MIIGNEGLIMQSFSKIGDPFLKFKYEPNGTCINNFIKREQIKKFF
jgi:hypothetical protein